MTPPYLLVAIGRRGLVRQAGHQHPPLALALPRYLRYRRYRRYRRYLRYLRRSLGWQQLVRLAVRPARYRVSPVGRQGRRNVPAASGADSYIVYKINKFGFYHNVEFEL